MVESSEPLQNKPQYLKISEKVENPYKSSQNMPATGDKIGPNKILTLIGEGGSANVYKVWHEGLEVTRAVKILKREHSQEARERFLTEAKILADIHHPNIVEIHNIGYLDQQVPFLEMEFIDGISVKKLLSRDGRLPLSVALSLGYFVCQALHYAHIKDYTLYGKVYQGLIHRDIKPDNIVISKDGIVKLMDFGIARPSEVSLHTVGAKIMGTLVYLSPEQLNGKSLNHRSDIFSLGAVLYEMITGRRAFPQKTITELVQKKSKGQFLPLEAHNIEVPKSMESIIEKCMALNPQDRYNNVYDLGIDLYATLREISEKAPQDILSRYTRDTSEIAHYKPKKKRSKWFWFISTGILLTIASLVSALIIR